MQEQITALEAQLQEKEQLVGALTERLEHAAEQLDRIHRTGGDRGLRVGGGFPPELVDQHKTLVEELQSAVGHWEDMQAAATLGRVESQLAELRELIADGVARPQNGGPVMQAGDLSQFMAQVTSGDSPAAADDSNAEPTSYEAIKASLLETAPSEGDQPATPIARDSAVAEAEIEPVDEPKPIDLDTAEADQLKQAVEQRDSYIAYLIRKLRVADRLPQMEANWRELESVPEELQVRLSEYERRLQETLRLAEVELSLERARLGREEAKLRMMEHQIRAQHKRLGLDGTEHDLSDREEAGAVHDDDKSGRWLRMLGIGRDDEDDD